MANTSAIILISADSPMSRDIPFEYRISSGEYVFWSQEFVVRIHNPLDVSNETPVPHDYVLDQSYPNPFNPTTTIRFDIPVGARHDSPLQLNIYDIAGRLVATLVDGWLNPGIHEIQWNGSKQASGVYFVEMVSGSFRVVQKMMLLK